MASEHEKQEQQQHHACSNCSNCMRELLSRRLAQRTHRRGTLAQRRRTMRWLRSECRPWRSAGTIWKVAGEPAARLKCTQQRCYCSHFVQSTQYPRTRFGAAHPRAADRTVITARAPTAPPKTCEQAALDDASWLPVLLVRSLLHLQCGARCSP